MPAESQFDLDIQGQAWSESPGDVFRQIRDTAPQTVTVLAEEAKAPSAHEAQCLFVLRTHVEASGGTFDVSNPSQAFCEGLTLLGLHDPILGKGEAQQ